MVFKAGAEKPAGGPGAKKGPIKINLKKVNANLEEEKETPVNGRRGS